MAFCVDFQSVLAAIILVAATAWPTILLDDAEGTGLGWHRGTFKPCLDDAHGDMYHHDFGADKGNVSAMYVFDPQHDGCYLVEEYHPGGSPHCARYLPDNARLDIDFCKGLTAYTYIDLSQGGGQWNVLGALPFFVGWKGRIRVTNAGTETTCKAHKDGEACFWVTDAYRLTRISDLSHGCRLPPKATSTSTSTLTTTIIVPIQQPPAQSVARLEDDREGDLLDILMARAPDLVQKVIDDSMVELTSPWQRLEALRKPAECGMQGWQQAFMFLDPAHSRQAETAIEFPFDPPEDGCYLLEEFHPAHICGRTLSKDVALTIHYCKGFTKLAEVDQSRDGNRWNSIGLFPFNQGYPGKVLVFHPQVSKAVAVADAFRFTRISASCEGAHPKVVQHIRLAQNPVSVVIDNPRPHSGAEPVRPLSCSKGAIGGGLLKAATGRAEARFQFSPSSNGCYRIDSYHPEGMQNKGCSLADEVELEVNYCLGRRSARSHPLRGVGGRWSAVGHYQFYAGQVGDVHSRRAQATPDGQHWLADAFRFTRVGDTCRKLENAGLFTLRITGTRFDHENVTSLDAGLTSYPDMRIALQQAVVDAVNLPSDQVHLLSMRKGSVIVDFEVRGTMPQVIRALQTVKFGVDEFLGPGSKLTKLLCAAVSGPSTDKGCRATLVSSDEVPAPQGTDFEALMMKGSQGSSWTSSGYVIGALAFAFISTATTICVCLHVKKKRTGSAVPGRKCAWEDPVQEYAEKGSAPSWDLKKVDGEKSDDEVSLAASTGTPTSRNELDMISVVSGPVVPTPSSPQNSLANRSVVCQT